MTEPIKVTYKDFTVEDESLRRMAHTALTDEVIECEIIEIQPMEVEFVTREDGNMVTASLDYLIQYSVKDVHQSEDGWVIEFENGALVANLDSERTLPEEDIAGLSLLTVLYGADDTRIRLGISGQNGISRETMVTLTPGRYTITDPRLGGEVHTPQQAGREDSLPEMIREGFRDMADAPDEAEEGAQEAVDGSEDVPAFDSSTDDDS